MATTLPDIKLFLSSNTVGGLTSLGGAISATPFTSQVTTGLTISGVAIDDAAMNAEGTGTLTYNPATQALTWKAPGDTQTGSAVTVSVNGSYEIRGYGATSGYLLVTVVALSLPVILTADTITVATRINILCEDLSKAEALAGHTDYHCFYVKNNGTTTITSLKLWIQSDTVGADTLALWKAATKNTTAEAIAADTTAPAGASFSSPLVEAAGIELGPLNATDTYYVWLQRVLPVGTTARISRDLSSLRFAALV